MASDIMWTLLQGLALFFVHPLLYIGILILFFLGVHRVKRERENFHYRVYDVIDELTSTFKPSLAAGAILTVLLVVLGLVFPYEWILTLGLVYLILCATTKLRFASPAYAVGLTMIVTFVLMHVTTGMSFIDQVFGTFDSILLRNALILLALLLLIEGVLVRKRAGKRTSPLIGKSKRGKFYGAHESKKLWILPVGFFIPNGAIDSLGWWPLLNLGGEVGYSFLVIPIFIGFQQLVSSAIPLAQIEKIGQRLIGFAVLVSLFAVISFFYPSLALYFAIATIIFRELFWQMQTYRDKNGPNYFSIQPHGLVILGVIPHTQAEKMQLQIGEVIMKVNGIPVNNEQSLYHALQKNSAFCKLEVMDYNGEIRFAQTALYDGEHYQIGVLFTKEEYTLQDSVV